MTRQEPIDVLRQRTVLALHELAADLAAERRRRVALEREVRDLRSQLAELKARELEYNAPTEAKSD
jgi:cell division protein FtsB